VDEDRPIPSGEEERFASLRQQASFASLAQMASR